MTDFVFEEMTPDLQAYLDLSKQHPGYKYDKSTSGKPTPESEAAMNAWREKLEALKKLLPKGLLQKHYQAKTEWFCRDESQQGEAKEHLSPSGIYKLVVTSHGTRPGCWAYSKGRIYEGSRLITTIFRNYSAFPFAWVERSDGAFLFGGEDYQGQSVVDLRTGEVRHYLPKEAEQGSGFCWSDLYPSPDGSKLAVEGCFWAGPYEVWIYDIRNPLAGPFPVLHQDDNGEFFRWEGSVAHFGRREDVIELPGTEWHGKSENDVTLEDLQALERYCTEKEISEEDIWKRVVVQSFSWTEGDPDGMAPR